MADSPYVVAVTAESFHRVVVDGSHESLVLVDFWADWCAPCRALMPVLASLADAYAGKLIVAKVNTEEEQALAAEYGIRSLPTVQLFKDGQPIDQFMGALPEAQVREFLDRHLPQESDNLLARAQGLAGAGDLEGATGLIAEAREADPENVRIRLAEAGIEAASGNIEDAQAILDDLPMELSNDPEAASLRGKLLFARLCADSPPESELASRLEANPADSNARYALAAHLVGRGDYEGALERLLELMKKDRGFEDDAGRKGMLMIFALLGGEGDLVKRYRSRMSSALY
jgi:putative thioredoxin